MPGIVSSFSDLRYEESQTFFNLRTNRSRITRNAPAKIISHIQTDAMGNVVNEYTRFVGFPADMIAKENLLFAINDKNLLKYQIGIKSSMTWEITASDAMVMNRLSFSAMSGGGQNTPYEYVEVSANADFEDETYLSNFAGYFTIEFENGDKMQFYCMQKGVLGVLDRYANIGTFNYVIDGNVYYYETIDLGPGTWLDRYIGANGTDNVKGTPTGATSATFAYGKTISGEDMARVCPKGFRIPVYGHETDDAAIKYIWDNSMYINASSIDGADGNTHEGYTNRWTIRKTTNPSVEYYYPNSGGSRNSTSASPGPALLWLYSNPEKTYYSAILLGVNGLSQGVDVRYMIFNSNTYVYKLSLWAPTTNEWAYANPADEVYGYWATSSDAPNKVTPYFKFNGTNTWYSMSPVRCIRDLP